jgi:hypothetical protein
MKSPKKYSYTFLAVLAVSIITLFFHMVGCNQIKTVNIEFPFEREDITNIEMYHYSGAPVSAEKKVVVAEDDIKFLYDMFKGLSLVRRETDDTAVAVTSFRFNLVDGTSYELIYSYVGVPTGSLKSVTSNVEYLTSADIGSYWSNIDLEAVGVEEIELPK